MHLLRVELMLASSTSRLPGLLVLALGIAACQGSDDDGMSAPARTSPGATPRPRARLPPVPPPPVPDDPAYPEYHAAEPIGVANEHLTKAMLELIKARTRLKALDADRYRVWIDHTDGRIRRLLPLLCSTRLERSDVDVEHTPIERLFPVKHVESALGFECIGFVLKKGIIEGEAWNGRLSFDAGTAAAARDAGGDDGATAP